ncbi:LacI family transcriptional regulator [bacterium LRH843]|nr:LacI family transcriptional regulator [bacterium LRH843]
MITIKDVAKRSGFSVATVSAVINKKPIVSEKAREKIEEAIQELGYKPNIIARSLKSSKTSSIGIIVKDIKNPFYPEIVYGLEKVAWANQFEVFLCNTEGEFEREQRYIHNLIGKQVEGVIIATAKSDSMDQYSKLSDYNIPYVFINRRPDQLKDYEFFVGADNVLASKKVVAHLKAHGYNSAGFISGPLSYSTFRDRYKGFCDAVKATGMTVDNDWLFFGDSNYSEETGYRYTLNLLNSGKNPEVIVCASDFLAFGVHKALVEKKVRIPEDIAIIGMDNNRFGEFIGLTTVDLQTEAMGEMAAEKLLQKIENNEVNGTSNLLLLEPTIVTRKTC